MPGSVTVTPRPVKAFLMVRIHPWQQVIINIEEIGKLRPRIKDHIFTWNTACSGKNYLFIDFHCKDYPDCKIPSAYQKNMGILKPYTKHRNNFNQVCIGELQKEDCIWCNFKNVSFV